MDGLGFADAVLFGPLDGGKEALPFVTGAADRANDLLGEAFKDSRVHVVKCFGRLG